MLISLLADLDASLKANCGPDLQQYFSPAMAQVHRFDTTVTFGKYESIRTPDCKKYHISACSHELMST